VRHFVADDPPPDLVGALTKRFQETDRDLKVVAEALLVDDRAWSVKATKARLPLEFYVAAARATGFSPLAETVFPDSRAIAPMTGLMA
jgi:uncharacterized protein (DUF1800 family)